MKTGAEVSGTETRAQKQTRAYMVTNSDKGTTTPNGARTVSSVNCGGETGHPMWKNETGPLSDTSHKKHLEMDRRLDVRPRTEIPRRKQGERSLMFAGLWTNSWLRHSTGNESENKQLLTKELPPSQGKHQYVEKATYRIKNSQPCI